MSQSRVILTESSSLCLLCYWDLMDEGWRTARCPEGRLDSGRLWQGRWASASDRQPRSPGLCAAETEEIWGPRCSLTWHTHTLHKSTQRRKHFITLLLAPSRWTHACQGLHYVLAYGYQESMLGKTLLLRRLPNKGAFNVTIVGSVLSQAELWQRTKKLRAENIFIRLTNFSERAFSWKTWALCDVTKTILSLSPFSAWLVKMCWDHIPAALFLPLFKRNHDFVVEKTNKQKNKRVSLCIFV